jgi:hypothetical protein
MYASRLMKSKLIPQTTTVIVRVTKLMIKRVKKT